LAAVPPWEIVAAPARTAPPVGKAVGATVWPMACVIRTVLKCEKAATSKTVLLNLEDVIIILLIPRQKETDEENQNRLMYLVPS
jgi:hypothetical protein